MLQRSLYHWVIKELIEFCLLQSRSSHVLVPHEVQGLRESSVFY
jgi:hypothetical protein